MRLLALIQLGASFALTANVLLRQSGALDVFWQGALAGMLLVGGVDMWLRLRPRRA